MLVLPQLSSEEVVKSYIERIKAIQPVLNCVVECRFEEALKEAKQCDEMLKSPNAPSAETLAKAKPFFGVPFTTKVNFNGSYNNIHDKFPFND